MEKSINALEYPAQIFSALGHPVRLAIMEILRHGEACVCHIQAAFGLRQAYASQHLNILRQAGLIKSRKEGTRVYYELTSADLPEIMDNLKGFLILSGKCSPEDFELNLDIYQPGCSCPQCAEKLTNERAHSS